MILPRRAGQVKPIAAETQRLQRKQLTTFDQQRPVSGLYVYLLIILNITQELLPDRQKILRISFFLPLL